MSTYTLIKKENNYLLCSDKKIETLEDDKVLLINGVVCRTELREGSVVSRQISGGATMDICKTECVELLASLHRIEGLPTLTFDAVVVKEIGYVDIDAKAELSWRIGAEEYIPLSAFHVDSFRKGYLQAIDDNKERRYTESDMLNAIQYGFEYFRDSQNDAVDVPNRNKRQWLQYYNSLHKTQWQVEIEMEKQHFRTVKDANGIPYDHEYTLIPKITNNSIKVTKVING